MTKVHKIEYPCADEDCTWQWVHMHIYYDNGTQGISPIEDFNTHPKFLSPAKTNDEGLKIALRIVEEVRHMYEKVYQKYNNEPMNPFNDIRNKILMLLGKYE